VRQGFIFEKESKTSASPRICAIDRRTRMMTAIDRRIKAKIATSKQKVRTRYGFLAAARLAGPAQQIEKKEIVFVIILSTGVCLVWKCCRKRARELAAIS
jgi:hypothetical protein